MVGERLFTKEMDYIQAVDQACIFVFKLSFFFFLK